MVPKTFPLYWICEGDADRMASSLGPLSLLDHIEFFIALCCTNATHQEVMKQELPWSYGMSWKYDVTSILQKVTCDSKGPGLVYVHVLHHSVPVWVEITLTILDKLHMVWYSLIYILFIIYFINNYANAHIFPQHWNNPCEVNQN